MSNVLQSLFAFLSGVLLGVFFYGGLWWTVRRGLVSPLPALWFSASFLIRTAVAVAGFYVVMAQAAWQLGLTCLVGFVLGRILVMQAQRMARLTLIKASP